MERVGRDRRHSLGWCVVLLATTAFGVASSGAAAAKPQLLVAKLGSAGPRVVVSGRVAPPAASVPLHWHLVLEQKIGRNRYARRASSPVSGRGHFVYFSFTWRARSVRARKAIVARVALVAGRKILARGRAQRVTVGPPVSVKARLKPSTFLLPSAAHITRVAAGGNGTTIVNVQGIPRGPAVGHVLVIDPSPQATRGVFGIVTSARSRGAELDIATRPAALGDAFAAFHAYFGGALSELGGEAASAPAHSAAVVQFSCSGGGALTPSIALDLSRFTVTGEIDTSILSPYFSFDVEAAPELTLGLKATGDTRCTATFPRRVVPIWGPLVVSIQPIVTVEADGQVQLSYSWHPYFSYQLVRGRHQDREDRVFHSNSDFSLEGAVHAHARLAVKAAVSLAERAGLEGTITPHVDATGALSDGRACLDVSGAVSYDLAAFADVFVKHWSWDVASGEFLHVNLLKACTPAPPGGPSGGPGEGGGGAPPPVGGGGFGLPWSGVSVKNAVAIGAGATSSCALISDHSVDCWGSFGDGELGVGPLLTTSGPQRVAGITTARQLAVGESTVCALLAGGTVDCWGYNQTGTVGNGANHAVYSPVQVSGITNAIAVSVGGAHACAILSTKHVVCWGDNYHGQLGTGSASGPEQCALGTSPPASLPCSTKPVSVTGITNALAIAAGGEHTCALLASGAVECWGEAGGFSKDDPSPVPVNGVGEVATLTAGNFTTCALLVSHRIRCWGSDFAGGLGNGLETAEGPVEVVGLSNAVAVSAGDFHVCAALATGAVECWGDNTFGELGVGTEAGPELCGGEHNVACSKTPAGVSGINNATGVGLGVWHSCALLGSGGGTVECWGWNNGWVYYAPEPTKPNALVPVSVP